MSKDKSQNARLTIRLKTGEIVSKMFKRSFYMTAKQRADAFMHDIIQCGGLEIQEVRVVFNNIESYTIEVMK